MKNYVVHVRNNKDRRIRKRFYLSEKVQEWLMKSLPTDYFLDLWEEFQKTMIFDIDRSGINSVGGEYCFLQDWISQGLKSFNNANEFFAVEVGNDYVQFFIPTIHQKLMGPIVRQEKIGYTWSFNYSETFAIFTTAGITDFFSEFN